MQPPMQAPDQIRVSADRRTLTVAWGEECHAIPAELLRVESPSAEVQGHGPGEKKLIAAKGDVTVADVRPTGRYAVRIAFSDGHDSGIYSWDLLRRFGREGERMLLDYDRRVREAGKAR